MGQINHLLEGRAWELEPGVLVAAHKNASAGTDYEARPSNHEPAHIVLGRERNGANVLFEWLRKRPIIQSAHGLNC